jgi:LPXTG-motif cell wall-anchored protein
VSIDGSTSLGTATVNADGSINSPFTLPLSVRAGVHSVSLAGTMSDGTAKTLAATITVEATSAAPAATTPPVTVTGSLPTTGSNIAAVVAIGSLLCLGGIGIVALTRRRTRDVTG